MSGSSLTEQMGQSDERHGAVKGRSRGGGGMREHGS